MNPTLPRTLLATTAALMLAAAGASAQDAGGRAGPSGPEPQTTQQTIPEEAGSALMFSEEPQYQETHEERGEVVGSDPSVRGSLTVGGPEYHRAHENKGVTIGPVD